MRTSRVRLPVTWKLEERAYLNMYTLYNKNESIFIYLPGVIVSTEMKSVSKTRTLKFAEDKGFSEKSMTLIFLCCSMWYLLGFFPSQCRAFFKTSLLSLAEKLEWVDFISPVPTFCYYISVFTEEGMCMQVSQVNVKVIVFLKHSESLST